MRLFCKYLRKCWHCVFYFHIWSKDKRYQCYSLRYILLTNLSQEKTLQVRGQGKVSENENLSRMFTLYMDHTYSKCWHIFIFHSPSLQINWSILCKNCSLIQAWFKGTLTQRIMWNFVLVKIFDFLKSKFFLKILTGTKLYARTHFDRKHFFFIKLW